MLFRSFRYEDNVWHGIPEELGMQIQFPATVANAYGFGRGGDEMKNLRQRVMARTIGVNLEPVLLFDQVER